MTPATHNNFHAEVARLRPCGYRTATVGEWPDTAPGSRFPTENQPDTQTAGHDNCENSLVVQDQSLRQRALANTSFDNPKGRSGIGNLAAFAPEARP